MKINTKCEFLHIKKNIKTGVRINWFIPYNSKYIHPSLLKIAVHMDMA